MQTIHADKQLRRKLFQLLEKEVFQPPEQDDSPASGGGLNPRLGRPGMTLWSVLGLALLKQALNCDFDRLAKLATRHESVRRMLGLGEFEQRRLAVRTVARNMQLLSADRLRQGNRLAAGRARSWRAGSRVLRCRRAATPSWWRLTGSSRPTTGLPRDALVAGIAVAAALSDQAKLPGWRGTAAARAPAGGYPGVARSWHAHWEQVTPFFPFTQTVRVSIYTTHAIEIWNSCVRRAVATRGHFPSDRSATQLIYRALCKVERQWKRPPPFRQPARRKLMKLFEDRF